MRYRRLLVCALFALGFVVTPLLASAAARLSDQEVKALLESIENKRSAFEGALDDTLKNSTIKTQRGEIKTNEFFDDLQDQVKRTRDRFDSDYSASSEIISLLQYASRLTPGRPRNQPGSRDPSSGERSPPISAGWRRRTTRPCSVSCSRAAATRRGGSTTPSSRPPQPVSTRTWMRFERPTRAR